MSSSLTPSTIATTSSTTIGGTLAVSGATTLSSTLAVSGATTSSSYIGSTAGTISDSTILSQGGYISWNISGGTGEMNLICKSGTGSGGFYFYNSTGNGSSFSTGKTLLTYIDNSGYMYNNRPAFRVYRSGGWSVSSGEAVTKGGTISFERNPSGGSRYNSTNGIYTVPVAGVYTFNVYIRCADGAGSLTLKPYSSSSGFSIPNSDNSYWVPTDGGNRRTMSWSETLYMSANTDYYVVSGQATTIQDFVFSGHFVSN